MHRAVHRQHRYTPPVEGRMGPDEAYLRMIRAQMALVDSMPQELRRQVHEHGMASVGIEAVAVSRTAAVQQAAAMAKRRATKGSAPRYVAPKIDDWNYGE